MFSTIKVIIAAILNRYTKNNSPTSPNPIQIIFSFAEKDDGSLFQIALATIMLNNRIRIID